MTLMKQNLKSPIRVITDLGIPTDSTVHAVQHIQSQDETHHYNIFGPYSQQEYEQMITEIMGLDETPTYDSWKIARVYFGYTVQETIRAFKDVDIPDMDDLWYVINGRAEHFMKEYPWAIIDYAAEAAEDDQKLDASGNPNKRKVPRKKQRKDFGMKISTSKKQWLVKSGSLCCVKKLVYQQQQHQHITLT